MFWLWLLTLLGGGVFCWSCRMRYLAIGLIARERGVEISKNDVDDAVDRVIRSSYRANKAK